MTEDHHNCYHHAQSVDLTGSKKTKQTNHSINMVQMVCQKQGCDYHTEGDNGVPRHDAIDMLKLHLEMVNQPEPGPDIKPEKLSCPMVTADELIRVEVLHRAVERLQCDMQPPRQQHPAVPLSAAMTASTTASTVR